MKGEGVGRDAGPKLTAERKGTCPSEKTTLSFPAATCTLLTTLYSLLDVVWKAE